MKRVFEFLTDRPEFFRKWVAKNLQNSQSSFYHQESVLKVTVESEDDAILWQMRFSQEFKQCRYETEWTLPFDKEMDFQAVRHYLVLHHHSHHIEMLELREAEDRRLGKLARVDSKWRNPNASIRTMQHSSRRASR